MRLSSREKILLCILAVVLIFSVSARFFVIPAIERIFSSTTVIKELGDEERQISMTADELNSIDDLLYEEKEIAEEEEYFFYDIDEVFADELLQEYSAGSGVEITKLSFSGEEQEEILDYSAGILQMLSDIILKRTEIYSDGNAAAVNTEAVEVGGLAESSGSSEGETDIEWPVINCRIEVSGQLGNIIEMVDRINNSGKSMRVSYMEGETSLNVFSGVIGIDIYYFN